MNGDRMRVVHLIFDKYKADYEAVFGALERGHRHRRGPLPGQRQAQGVGRRGRPWEMMAAADRDIASRVST